MKPIKLLSSTIELTAELASLNSEFSEDTAELVSVGEPTVTTTVSFPLNPVSSPINSILYSKTPSVEVSTVHVIALPSV